MLIGAEYEAGDGEILRMRMAETIVRLQQLSREAERLDGSAARSSQDDKHRDEALKLLAASVVALQPAIATISAQGSSGNILAAWGAIEAIFDEGAGRDLRQVLNESIRTETDLLASRRADADRALVRLNLLSLATTVLLGLAALGLAVYFARALRRPLHDLVRGAEAFARAELGHRIPVRGRDEFAGAATSINRMAQELSLRRDQEALVAERTAALEEALDGLRQSERRRRQLLGEISHELRTPMAAIRGEAEVTLRGARSEAEYRAALTRVGQASQQLAALIDDLIMMARSDGETLPLDRQPVDARLPLEEALVTLTSAAQQRQIRLETDVDAPATLFCDPVRLQQIITLLLDNAVRYSHPGGTVRVKAQADDSGAGQGHWRLDIVDQGIGIAPDELDRVFERTYRAGNARGHRPNGMGLGLAIARHLAERQEGTIVLDSRLGEGTARGRLFPWSNRREHPDRRRRPARVGFPGAGAAGRRLSRPCRPRRPLGDRAGARTCGELAPARAERRDPARSDAALHLRAGGIATPILMLTALGAVSDRISGLRMGADDYMVKPFAFDELLARIEALMRRSRDIRPVADRNLVVGCLELDRATMRVFRDGEEISLTARELALLELFMSAPGRVLSRERILANVWGVDEDPLTNVVDVYVRRLRSKLDRAAETSLISTLRGLGYRLES